MPSYAVILRTHVWDPQIHEAADRLVACCPDGDFYVAADESHGFLAVEPFSKISHDNDFSSFGLPNLPEERVLWWNGDYVFYAIREVIPDYDFYVILEYDVFVTCDISQMIQRCAGSGIDFVAHDIKLIPDDHWSRDSIADIAEMPWWAFVPFVILSARAIDVLRETRQALARDWKAGRIAQWPYCETFIPTILMQRTDMVTWVLDRFANVELLRFRPFLSTRDPRLHRDDIIAHPVLAGARFIKAFLANEPPGSHVMTDGQIRPELRAEDPFTLQEVLGDRAAAMSNPEVAAMIARSRQDLNEGMIDLARDKPATQSSISQWSNGTTVEEDAAGAVTGDLPDHYAFHTSGVELDPWWQVDLLELCIIRQVEIINRLDEAHRFTNFRIETSLDGEGWVPRFTKVDGARVSSDPADPAVFVVPGEARGRFLRIVQIGDDVMHLRQVRVMGFTNAAFAARAHSLPVRRPMAAAAGENPAAMSELVASILNREIFGQVSDSYDIDRLAFLSAGIDSSQYATHRMAAADRFASTQDLHDFAIAQTPASGLVLEFGVYSGTTINHLADGFPDRRVFGFDSFEGLPEAWRPDFPKGTFQTDIPAVRENVALVVGWFEHTLPVFVATHAHDPIALLHVDCDLYSSTQSIFHHLADRLRPGSIIIFDEYFNYPGWRLHEFKSFQELVQAKKITYEYIGLVPSHQQVVVRITGITH